MRTLPNEPSEYPAYLAERLKSLPPEMFDLFAAEGAAAYGAAIVHRQFLWRMPEWVTPDILKSRRRWIKGYVTKCETKCVFIYHVVS